jgi:UPF0042 nucleotide-binding protein
MAIRPPQSDAPSGKTDVDSARIVLVTGMSGAGRSSALGIFEDMGYEAVDNLPLSLLSGMIRGGTGARPLAIGVDIRTRDFGVESFIDELDRLDTGAGRTVETVYLDCDDEVLLQRYTETRRRHPLDADRPIPDVIKLERRLLGRLRDRADLVIDTTSTTPWDLKRELNARFASTAAPGLGVFVTSFSYRRGLPREADLVFDVRFLDNPHYDAELRALNGTDTRVADFVARDPDFDSFLANIQGMLDLLLPRFEREGKSYLTIAVGCTGGRHRSVFVAGRIAEWLEENNWHSRVHHRDIEGEGGQDMG